MFLMLLRSFLPFQRLALLTLLLHNPHHANNLPNQLLLPPKPASQVPSHKIAEDDCRLTVDIQVITVVSPL
ncbi:hypothetical protein PILCRDRAFT_825207 [Piloderma croceum F 1598]|uniref:Secreted protein n=1 Tax=Piloderma croceum (strain F 1598) TaxID=765440 RepID=A0A0C3FD40_PILCF|nr:hypothetical protein PILCRDRAFT_825207 [Piloderma croceum F 1598]